MGGGGVFASVHAGMLGYHSQPGTPLDQAIPWTRPTLSLEQTPPRPGTPVEQTHPLKQTPSPWTRHPLWSRFPWSGACWEIWSTSGVVCILLECNLVGKSNHYEGERPVFLTLCAPNATIVNLPKKSCMHQILPQFECLEKSQNKSLLSFYWSIICVKLNETKVHNNFHLKYILNIWFQLKIHRNFIWSLLGT